MFFARFSFLLLGMGFSAPMVSAQTFYSMNFSETNMRTGNSTAHPILAVYGQRGTPFEILSVLYPDAAYRREGNDRARFAGIQPSWYRVRDFEGQTGWIKSNQLGRKRALMIVNTEQATMYGEASHEQAIALLPKHLVVYPLRCTTGWCHVRFRDVTHGEIAGWVSRDYLWGNTENPE